MPTPCYLLRLFRFQYIVNIYIVNIYIESTGLLHVRWPKNKKRRGGNFFSLGGKKLKLFCIFWRLIRCGDWAEKNANVLCLWVGFFPI
jgi:hypothetical protein